MRVDVEKKGLTAVQLAGALGVIAVLALVVPPMTAMTVNRMRVHRAEVAANEIAQALRVLERDSALSGVSKGAGAPAASPDFDVLVGPGENPREEPPGRWTRSRSETLTRQLIVGPPETTGAGMGWKGPYLHTEPQPDPWGNRYVINIGASDPRGSGAPRSVWVLSAGPNGIIETAFDQPATRAALGGDDVGVRVR
jgi:hypothetical protein